MLIRPEVANTVSLEFSALARRKVSQSEKIVSLGLGEPGFPTPEPIIQAAEEAMRSGATRYSTPWGIPELREKIKVRAEQDFGREVPLEDVIVTMGAKQALSLALMSILQPGDEVISFSPCYVSYLPQIYMAEPDITLNILCLERDDFSIDPEVLRAAITPKTKAIIVNFPHNPTGKILSAECQDQIAEIIRETGVYLVSDEIYSKLSFSGKPFRSFGAYPEIAEQTIVIDGFSKAFSMTGWRIGYLIGPKPVVKMVSVIQQHLNTNVPVFIQKAASCAMDLPPVFYEDYNTQLRTNEQALADMLKDFPQIHYVDSDGGLFAFLDVSPVGLDSDTFCTELLKEKSVAITPGKVFGESWDTHIRVSLAGGCDEFSEGMRLLGEFLSERLTGKEAS